MEDPKWLITAFRWWLANDRRLDRIPLRLGAAAAILHEVRVLIFVIGRTALSILGIIDVLIIWRVRKQKGKVR